MSDTIENLKSFDFPLSGEYLFILDNGSTDGSVPALCKYFEDNKKPYYKYEEGDGIDLIFARDVHFYVIAGKTNRGFAGGNNYAISMAMTLLDFSYFWLLNNDTTIRSNSLAEMIHVADSSATVGFVGSVLMDYYERNKIQCCGGRWLPFFGVAKLVLKNKTLEDLDKDKLKVKQSNYQHGASLLVKSDVIRAVGLLDETFFMYAEEVDWQIRGIKKKFQNVVALNSVVHHKGSVSTENRKHLFYYYYNRASIILNRKHFPFAILPSALALLVITGLRSAGHFKNILFGVKGVFHGLFARLNTSNR